MRKEMEGMQNYTTIVGVIELRQRGCSYEVIQKRYSIRSSTLQLIMCPARPSFNVKQIIITLIAICLQIPAKSLQERFCVELCSCFCVMIDQDRWKAVFSAAEDPHPGICFRIALRLIRHLNPCFICHQIFTHQ